MTKAEQFINSRSRNCSNELCYEEGLGNLYEPWLTPDQALRAVEIAKGELIGKAYEWLKENLWKVANDLTDKEDKDRFIKEFCKAMEE